MNYCFKILLLFIINVIQVLYTQFNTLFLTLKIFCIIIRILNYFFFYNCLGKHWIILYTSTLYVNNIDFYLNCV